MISANDGPIDLQVNGFAGVDFNADNISPAQFDIACEELRKDGVAQILATIITDSIENMAQRLKNIVRARIAVPNVAEMIGGIHIEGPFLNEQPGFIGAHPGQHAMPANWDAMQILLEAADGLTRIVTLAPESDHDYQVTRKLANAGIVVSAGHCDPNVDQLKGAIDAGLSMFTHLGNGCPLHMHRHDNIIQRALSLSDYLHIGFIADGIHVPFVALKNYLAVAGLDRAFMVTDAVAAAGKGPGVYQLAGRDVEVDENLATWVADRSHLVGSASTMSRVQSNLKELGFSKGQIIQLTRDNPLAALKRSRTCETPSD